MPHEKYTLVQVDRDNIPDGVPVYAAPQLYTTSFPKGIEKLSQSIPTFVRQEDLDNPGGWSQAELDSLKESSQNTLDFPTDDR